MKLLNSVIFLAVSLVANLIFPSANAAVSDNQGAAAPIFYWRAPAHSEMTWMTRDVLVTKSGDGTYFSIIGNWTPPFYLGVQDFNNPATGRVKKVAIFSAWDTYENNICTDCGPETRPSVGKTTMKEIGPGVTPGEFGYEGTGVNAFINDFGWKVGDRIRAVVSLRPVSDGTEISAALQLNESKWRYFGTYKYAAKFTTLEPGYSFIEDFGNTPRVVRAAEFGNTWMENEDASIRTPINSVTGWANGDANKNYHLYKQLNPTGLWAQAGGDEFFSKHEYVPFKLDVPQELLIPLEARISALNLSGEAQRIYEQKYLESKWNRVAKAAAELKAKQAEEAKDKAVADAKAAAEAAAKIAQDKAVTDAKSAAEAAAKIAQDKAVADAKSAAEAAVKIAQDKAVTDAKAAAKIAEDKAVADAKAAAEAELAASKTAAKLAQDIAASENRTTSELLTKLQNDFSNLSANYANYLNKYNEATSQIEFLQGVVKTLQVQVTSLLKPKSETIVCTKGSAFKVVKGITPKCPVGYKRN